MRPKTEREMKGGGPNRHGLLEYYKRRYAKARATSDLWISLLEACYHYTIPSRNLYYWTSQYQGAQKNARVYDTTAVAGLRTLVSKLQRSLTPPQQRWATLTAGTDIPEDQQERVNQQLQVITNIIFDYLRNSNFDPTINECYYDLGIGTASLIVNEGLSDDKPLMFYSVPLSRLAIEDSVNGLLESNYRWWDEIKISDIQIMWPNAILSHSMRQMMKEDPNASIKNLVEGSLYEHRDKKPYTYVLFYENELLLEEKQESSPWITFRWSKVNNEIYGRGPVIEALPSILSLNEIARIELTSANMNISKPIMAYSDGIFNPHTFKLEPNTIIPIAPSSGKGGQYPLIPFPDTANPQFMQLTTNDLRMQINKLLYADPLGPIEETPNKTATELTLRQQNLAEEIGPAFTRLQQEFLARLINRVIYILKKRGLLPKIEINGKEIQIKYQSPLVIAQGQQDVQSFMQYAQFLAALYGPEQAVIYYDPIKLPMWASRKMGVDPTILNSEEQMENLFQAQAEKAEEDEILAKEGALNGTIKGQPISQGGRSL